MQELETRVGEPEPVLITVDQASKVMGVCKSIVYRKCLSGEWPSVKIGAKRLVNYQGLKDWAAENAA